MSLYFLRISTFPQSMFIDCKVLCKESIKVTESSFNAKILKNFEEILEDLKFLAPCAKLRVTLCASRSMPAK